MYIHQKEDTRGVWAYSLHSRNPSILETVLLNNAIHEIAAMTIDVEAEIHII